MQRLTTVVDGYAVTARLHPASTPNLHAPLLVGLHGGLYTGRYFEVPGSIAGSFVEIANRNGYRVLTIDRPGYGDSDLLPEDENTFEKQAELLDGAISNLIADVGASSVVLVGHSIGGMIGLEIAARRPSWNLVGVSATGMGARIPEHGAAEALAALPLGGVVDVPVPEREKLWYGPAGSYSADAVETARSSYAAAPMVELAAAPRWAAQRLTDVAATIDVPVHHALAEFDALWDSSIDARELFLSKFRDSRRIHSEIIDGVGHCLDHHLTGAALHYKQLAFATECTLLPSATPAPTTRPLTEEVHPKSDKTAHTECLLCAMEQADDTRVVFRDELWAAEIVTGMEVPGWFVLRARRHAERITGLDDDEVSTLGRRARDLTAAVTKVTGAPATYLMVFGENHRHFHALIAARGDDVPTDRRSGNILRLVTERADPAAATQLVPAVREAYALAASVDAQSASST